MKDGSRVKAYYAAIYAEFYRAFADMYMKSAKLPEFLTALFELVLG